MRAEALTYNTFNSTYLFDTRVTGMPLITERLVKDKVNGAQRPPSTYWGPGPMGPL